MSEIIKLENEINYLWEQANRGNYSFKAVEDLEKKLKELKKYEATTR